MQFQIILKMYLLLGRHLATPLSVSSDPLKRKRKKERKKKKSKF